MMTSKRIKFLKPHGFAKAGYTASYPVEVADPLIEKEIAVEVPVKGKPSNKAITATEKTSVGTKPKLKTDIKETK